MTNATSDHRMLEFAAAFLTVLILGLFTIAISHAPRGDGFSHDGRSDGAIAKIRERLLDHCPNVDAQCLSRAYQLQTFRQPIANEVMRLELGLLQIDNYEAESKHRMFTLWANYMASWMLFAIVVAIVTCGLHMSYLQLSRDLKTGRPNQNGFKISKEGLEVNSAVIGLLIFGASAYFFYVYVEKVYPITFLTSPYGPPTISPSAPAGTGTPESPK